MAKNTPRPVNLTDRQRARLRELLSFLPLPVAMKAMGVSEDSVRATFDLPDGPLDPNKVLAALASKVVEHDEQLTAHGKQFDRVRYVQDAHEQALTGMKPAINGAHAKADALKAKVEQLGIGIDTLLKALQAGEIGGDKSFLETLRSNGVSDTDIKAALGVMDELELTNAQAFAELTTSFLAHRRTTDEALNQHGQTLYGNGDDQPGLVGRMGHVEEAVEWAHTRIDASRDIHVRRRLTWWSLLAIPAFALTWWIVSNAVSSGPIMGVGAQSKTQLGSVSIGISWLLTLGLSLIAAGVVIYLTSRTSVTFDEPDPDVEAAEQPAPEQAHDEQPAPAPAQEPAPTREQAPANR